MPPPLSEVRQRRALDSIDSREAPWAERCAFWLKVHDRAVPKRLRRQRRAEPLILAGHGLSIRVEKGTLAIRDGNTHYPAERRSWRFFKGALDIPPRIVLVDGSGEITLDALDWMAAQDVALIRLNWDGEATAVMSPNGYAADPERVAWQRATREDTEARLAFASALIVEKLTASIDTLGEHVPASRARQHALVEAEAARATLMRSPSDTLSDLLGIEGRAAKAYWMAWRGVELAWKGETQRPIQDEWRRFTSRASLTTGVKGKNRNASHPINAMLNYAYGALTAQLRVQALAEGFDPLLGIVHSSYQGSPAYVLDLMEPERPRVDAAVLKLVCETTLSGADFTLREDGVCRLNPELARRVAHVAIAAI